MSKILAAWLALSAEEREARLEASVGPLSERAPENTEAFRVGGRTVWHPWQLEQEEKRRADPDEES